ncbi:hypothetical protein Rumeso_02725 [Rubellimicrobium mesophilum DSM 19309]|uniref:Uncharacterized protein n=1 Tax=Rubellimicrobium mesophilum DSM 19309 TaxID=442562 RepID=A0A017HNB9_9RHOB|nr:hypothetical protein [Rubellimicrobium mesophilum]EYD75638.1 hypothetical protein Rumeso_02725 [Rubellimicrobium mesophilum DSM 19309]
MTVAAENKASALAVAALLERWADEVPHWDPSAGERWDAFADRRYLAEKALKERLRRLPTCVLRTDDCCTEVDFTLAGVRVRSRVCLEDGCRAWAAKMRRQAAQ